MPVFLGAFPVLPGKEDDARKFGQETLGRTEEWAASQKRAGVTQEEWALQESPMGALILVRFECNDIEHAFVNLAQSTETFEVWFKDTVKAITGVDLSAPSDAPPPEMILSWNA